jgi:hypothetical protein
VPFPVIFSSIVNTADFASLSVRSMRNTRNIRRTLNSSPPLRCSSTSGKARAPIPSSM